jgi:hypothetical protein
VKNPWPRYPCHTCATPDVKCGTRRYGLEVGEVDYAWATDYAWHTAVWNKTTGHWRAKCCRGHVVKGRARGRSAKRRRR